MAKTDCFNCVHRRDEPGDNGSRCVHKVAVGPEISLLSVNGGECVNDIGKMRELGITAKTQGLTTGQFNWPWDFKPEFLEKCDGFEGGV